MRVELLLILEVPHLLRAPDEVDLQVHVALQQVLNHLNNCCSMLNAKASVGPLRIRRRPQV